MEGEFRVINSRSAVVPIESLRPYPGNPRRGSVDAVAESMERNGIANVIVVQESTNYILAGHTRLESHKKRGDKTAPVVFVDCDDATARRILLADNRTSDLAEYESRALVDALLASVDADEGLEGTAFDEVEMAEWMRELAMDPEADAIEASTEILGLEIHCKSEKEQLRLLEELARNGHDCRSATS
jgi:hypothetical protein